MPPKSNKQPDPYKPYIIAVTGTKGKTTVVRLLNHIYHDLGRTTLLVDTDGHYLNGKQLSTYDDAMQLNSLVPTVSPGRYLRDLKGKKNSLALLETAIGSANIYGGLGYRFHNIGVFTNVFEDHIGEGISSREQLAELKAKYIFKRIAPSGTAIFNADDELICNELHRVPKDQKVNLLPVGIDFKHFDIEKHRANKGRAMMIDKHTIYVVRGKRRYPVINAKNVPWTFDGQFTPSLYNVMFAAAAAFVENGHRLTADMVASIRNYKLHGGGRLLYLENKRSGIRAIVDYAHEKYSLREVANLANKLKKPGGKSIGVIRLAPDRTDKLLRDTGTFIANIFDIIIIYDKVDGVIRSTYENKRTHVVRRTGEVSKLIYDAMKKASDADHKVQRKVIETEAIDHAFSQATSGDVIVHIANDDHGESLRMVKKKLGRFGTVQHT